MNVSHLKFPLNNTVELFKKISTIPRKTGAEEEIANWLINWAAERGLTAKKDSWSNVVIDVPAVDSILKEEVFVLQGHLDMVCQKTEESSHDFAIEGITLVEDGDWLKADRTTLGADNGIAVAMMLAVVESGLPHRPLQLLFTVQEEIGLVGAANLTPDFLSTKAKYLLNLDSEETGVVTLGCAGAVDTQFEQKYPTNKPEIADILIELSLTGGIGGHSGVEINKGQANAIKLLTKALQEIAKIAPIKLVSLEGGNFRNAIPANCQSRFYLPAAAYEQFPSQFSQITGQLLEKYSKTDTDLQFNFQEINQNNLSGKPEKSLSILDSDTILEFIEQIPTGVINYATENPELVETSNNLGIINLQAGKFSAKTMHRSSNSQALKDVNQILKSLATQTGVSVETGNSTLPWSPDFNSQLVKIAQQAYQSMFNRPVSLRTVHAGLECGVILAKYPNLQAISIGPTIVGAHTTIEKLYLPAVAEVGDWLLAILNS